MYKMSFLKAVVAIVAAAFIALSCAKDQVEQTPYSDFAGIEVPPHFPQPHYNNPENTITQAGFELGRKLFYDKALSSDGTISCGSCHAQVHAFADHNVAFSTGVEGRIGTKNSPTLSNLAWYPSFMADGGINHIEVMPLAPISDPAEMNETLANVVEKLNNRPDYKAAFKNVFGVDKIESKQVFYSIAQFQSMLVSSNSKYDDYVLGNTTFNEAEERGLGLFRTHCVSCHTEPLFTDFSFVNNGLDMVHVDAGRALVTQNPQDSGKFKVPSLRNIALTHPYMHDGRFYTLQMVLDHYSDGVKQNGHLDDRLQQTIALTAQDKQDLIIFLETLTDVEFISDSRFGEPRNP